MKFVFTTFYFRNVVENVVPGVCASGFRLIFCIGGALGVFCLPLKIRPGPLVVKIHRNMEDLLPFGSTIITCEFLIKA